LRAWRSVVAVVKIFPPIVTIYEGS
jgi:hypothetical protein